MRLKRPPAWLWLLAWAMSLLLVRAISITRGPVDPIPLKARTASPFDERWGGDFNTSVVPQSPDPRG